MPFVDNSKQKNLQAQNFEFLAVNRILKTINKILIKSLQQKLKLKLR